MNKKFTPTPHDALFKQFLGKKETAKDFLEIWLPDDIKALYDLETIKLEPGSFIDEDMKSFQSDILYSVKTTKGDGYLYCLIEHQSNPDKLIAWRLLRYSMAVMQQHLEQGHKTLPIVLPILFYCGKQSPHPYSTNWLDCFKDREVAERIYNRPFILADVTVVDDDEIMQHRRMAILELLQKHIRQRDMSELMDKIVKILSYEYHTDKEVIMLMNYLIQEGNAKNPMQFIIDITKQSQKHEEALMTIANSLKQEGIQEGKKQASIEIARQMLKEGMDKNTIMKFTGLTEKNLSQIENQEVH